MPVLILPVGHRSEWSFSRFLVKTAQCGQRIVEVRKISHRSNFSRFIERDPPILSVSKELFLRHSIGEIFLRVLVHLDTDFFSSINFELRFTKYGIFQETIVNPFKIYLDASLSQIMGNMVVFLFFSLSISMRSSLLNDVILI